MAAITVEFIENGQVNPSYGWKVSHGDQYADQLTWDEMIGLFLSLAMLNHKGRSFPGLQWLKTSEQHAEDERRRQERLEQVQSNHQKEQPCQDSN